MNQYCPGGEPSKQHISRIENNFYGKYLSGDNVLDIGGGDGPAIVPHAKIIDIGFPGYDGLILPFLTSSQDAVFSSHCLEHVDDPVATLKEWFRVLKPKGHLIITVPHQHLYERKMNLPSRWNGDHRRFYTPARLLSDIESALDVNTYRVRSLRDNDDGFDYSVARLIHAKGCYEIEIVVEKLADNGLLSFDYAELMSHVILDGVEPLAVCGAGELGAEIITVFIKEGIEISFVTDKKISNIEIGGNLFNVVPLEIAINAGCRRFVIASDFYKTEIEKEIRNLFNGDLYGPTIYGI